LLPDRSYPAAHSNEDDVAKLPEASERMRVDGAADDEWLFSWGYHQLWHGELNRHVLDSVSATRPISVWQRSCHEFYLNTAGLQERGILDDGWVRASTPRSWRPPTPSPVPAGVAGRASLATTRGPGGPGALGSIADPGGPAASVMPAARSCARSPTTLPD
jgi:hypothetical protein